MNVLTTEHKNLSSNPTKNDRAVTGSSNLLFIEQMHDVPHAVLYWYAKSSEIQSCKLFRKLSE